MQQNELDIHGEFSKGLVALKSAKQEKFAREYIKDMKPKQAALRAGYNEASASCQAYKNLRNTKILARIDYLLLERKKTLGIDEFFVVQGFMDIYNKCMQKTPVMVFDPVEKEMVQATEVVVDENGNERVEGLWAFDANNANKALENIGKYLGMFVQKVDINNNQQVINWNVDVSPFMKKPPHKVVAEIKETGKLSLVQEKMKELKAVAKTPQKRGRKPKKK